MTLYACVNLQECDFGYIHLENCLNTDNVGVSGVAVSMVAFQAIDPGSTPGSRKYFQLGL